MPRSRSHPLLVVIALLLLPLAAARLGASPGIATIERISVGNGPMEPNGGCFEAREGISADGRFVVFASWASNLVRGDLNETGDIFVSDRQTGATERISVTADGAEGTIESTSPTISADGRYVAFVSANAFAAGASNGYTNVYVKDRVTGSLELVSHSDAGVLANGDCVSPSLSGDGRFVAFETEATNLAAGDNENYPDVYVQDRQTNTIKRASGTVNPNSSGQGAAPTLSPDGRFVAFTSRGSNLVPGDFNSIPDVFVRDLQTDAIERVSVSTDGSVSGSTDDAPAISDDGRFVAFGSGASLVPGDSNSAIDVFVRDRLSGTTERISRSASGLATNARSQKPGISGDGRYVVFESNATNLIDGQTTLPDEIYLRDRVTGSIQLLSVPRSTLDIVSPDFTPSISGNGRFIIFTDHDEVPGDYNMYIDVYVRDRVSMALSRASNAFDDPLQPDNQSTAEGISADGRFVAFSSWATNVVPGDMNRFLDVFVRDRQLGVTELVSRDSSGASAGGFQCRMTPDARYVTFGSITALVAQDNNGTNDIYLRDRSNGSMELISISTSGSVGNGASTVGMISDDGRYVAFRSSATNLVSGDTNGVGDVFVRDRVAGTTERVSVGPSLVQANAECFHGAFSGTGQFISFTSRASNLVTGDTNSQDDVFLRDRVAGTTERLSVATNGTQSNASSGGGAISLDGRYFVFSSAATNLVTGDTNDLTDVFLRDRVASTTERVSVSSSGQQADLGAGGTVITPDGRRVFFSSAATNLVPSDTNGRSDFFVRDLQAGTTERINLTSSGAQSTGPVSGVIRSTPDFRFMAFATTAADLLGPGNDENGVQDIYLLQNYTGAAPVASAAAVNTQEDTAVSVSLQASDTDSDALTYIIVSPPQHGTLSGSGAARTYTPAADYNGPDSFTFKANDGVCDSNIAAVSITVNPVNDAPAAISDGFTATEDTPLNVTAGMGVLANDTDVEGQPLTAVLGAGPVSGDLTLNANGSFTYTPDANFNGSDSFTYRAADGAAQSAVTTVTLSVTAVNDPTTALDQSVSTPEDTAKDITLMVIELDGDPLTYTIVSPPTHGALSGAGASHTYTPAANYHGPDSFTFLVNDGQANSAPATVSLIVTPVNDAPAGNDDNYTLNEDTVLTVPALGVLANDLDADRDALSAAIVAEPEQGDLTLNADGGFTYTPQANYHGPDSFTYQASDGASMSASTTVTLTIVSVNDPPTAQNLSFTLNEDSQQPIDLQGADADGDPLTYLIVSSPTHGALSGSGVSRTYSPAANYAGPDQFTYRVSDGAAESGVATVSLTVTPVADAPVASGQSVTTQEDSAKSITLVATDADGSSLTYSIVASPQHGSLSGTGATRTYTPTANFNGADSFTFRASDGSSQSNLATVAITVTSVNDPPLALGQTVSVMEDAAKTINLSATDADGDSLTFTIVTAPTQGALSGSGAARTYTPAANFNGTDSFTFLVNDGAVNSSPATVSLTVSAVDDFTVANGDSYAVDEDTTLTVPAPGVLANDANPDGGALTLTVITLPAHGAVTLNQNGGFTYVPALNYSGTDGFRYELRNARGETSSAGVFLTIRPLNDPPTVQNLTVTGNEDSDLTVPLLASDPEGDSLTYILVTSPANGTLTGAGGSRTYRPAANFSGTDTLTFKASDGTLESGLATVTLVVSPVNDPPTAVSQSVSTPEDTPRSITLTGSDPDGDALTFQIVSTPQHGVLSGSGAERTYTPAVNFNGSDQFTFRVSDGSAQSASATISISISPQNDPPVAHAGADQTVEASGGQTTVILNATASTDPDGNPLTYEWRLGQTAVGAGARPTVSLPLGAHDLTLLVSDSQGLQSSDEVRVTVQDTTPPQLTLPNTLTVPPSTPVGAHVSFAVTATDLLPGVTVMTTPDSGALFPLGATTVQCLARDAAGNEAMGSFQVVVALPAPPAARVTASGAIPVTGGAGKLKLSVQSKPGKPLKGSLSFTDPATRQTIKSTALTGLVIEGRRAQVFGRATVARGVFVDFLAEAEDLGTVRGIDRFRLELSDGRVWGSAALSSGSVKIGR